MRPDPLETLDLLAFTGEILNGKLHFLCSVIFYSFDILFSLYDHFTITTWREFTAF